MPCTARASLSCGYYHVLNRDNARMRVFHRPADYAAFYELLTHGGIFAGLGVRGQ